MLRISDIDKNHYGASRRGWCTIFLEAGCKKELGRGPGIASRDLTVSRRQVLLELPKENDENGFIKVHVQVKGANPICILRSDHSKEKPILEFLKKGEQGYLGIGDRLSLSVKEPHFFTLRKECSEETANPEEDEIEEAVARRQRRAMERKERETKQTEDVLRRGHNGELEQGPERALDLDLDQREAQIQDLGLDALELSQIDPAAEFGFLVEGSEFEQYGKRWVKDFRKWDWCLSKDSEKNSKDEDSTEEWELKHIKSKKKGKHENEDEDWTGESDEEKMQVAKLKQGRKPKYLKPRSKIQSADVTHNVSANTEPKEKQLDNNLQDDDDTLGGFIVDDEESETTDEEEEEDEWTDDDVEEEDEVKDKTEHEIQKGKNRKERKPLCKYGSNCYRKNKDHLAEFRHS